MKSDRCLQVMSLEPASFQDYKSENKNKSVGVELERIELTRPLRPLLFSAAGYRLQDTLVATSITHHNLTNNCSLSSFIVVGDRFDKW